MAAKPLDTDRPLEIEFCSDRISANSKGLSVTWLAKEKLIR